MRTAWDQATNGFSILYLKNPICVAGGESPTYQAIRLCKTADVVVISSSYRLAPESRLPIAFNDAYTTMSWLQKQVNQVLSNLSSDCVL